MPFGWLNVLKPSPPPVHAVASVLAHVKALSIAAGIAVAISAALIFVCCVGAVAAAAELPIYDVVETANLAARS